MPVSGVIVMVICQVVCNGICLPFDDDGGWGEAARRDTW